MEGKKKRQRNIARQAFNSRSPICSFSTSNKGRRAAGACSSGSPRSRLRAPTGEKPRLDNAFLSYPCLNVLSHFFKYHTHVCLLLEVASGRLPERAWWPSRPASHTNWRTARRQRQKLTSLGYLLCFNSGSASFEGLGLCGLRRQVLRTDLVNLISRC